MRTTLAQLFEQLDSIDWKMAAYFPPMDEAAYALDTPCLVWDPDDYEDDNDYPTPAIGLGFESDLGIADILSIRENARQQLGRLPTPSEMLAGLAYYLSHDAFRRF